MTGVARLRGAYSALSSRLVTQCPIQCAAPSPGSLLARPGDFELPNDQSRASMCRNGMVSALPTSFYQVSMRSIDLLGNDTTTLCDTRNYS